MLKYKTGDAKPPYITRLLWSDGSAIDLSEASSVTLYLIDESTGSVVYSGSCDILEPTSGLILHEWEDTSNLNGIYRKRIQVVFQDGKVVTIPSDRLEYIMFW